jgi:CheY-like chemotaxis protein
METRASARRILVVDDSEDMREFYELILTEAGYDVEVAASGEEGFEKARRLRPDLALLDVVMPGMDGLQLLLKLRSDLAPPVPPVILCSGFDLSEEEALRRGAIMFVRKPVSPDFLLMHLQRALAGQPVGADVIARSRSYADAARRRARTAAAEIVRNYDANVRVPRAELAAVIHGHLAWLSRYFDLSTVMAALMRDDALIVEQVAGSGWLRAGEDLSQKVPQSYEVLETGSSLIFADAAQHPCFAAGPSGGDCVRFFAGVPLRTVDDVPVGVVCAFDQQPRQFYADDLVILEQFGRRGSALLDLLARGRFDQELPGILGAGLLARVTFELLLDAEARILRRAGGSLEIIVVELHEVEAARTVVLEAREPQRLAATTLGTHRVGLFKRDPGPAAARKLEEILAQLSQHTVLCAAGSACMAGDELPALSGQDLLHLAEVALDGALETGGGMQRLVLQQERTNACELG